MQSYPHAILYDFEAYGDKNQRKEPTGMLTSENAHVPISVSIGDTLEREPTHICEKNPLELVRKFMEEMERRGKNIRSKVQAGCMPDDVKILPKAQRLKIEEWCDQVPLLGFNSVRYDLNLIREHFAERLADTTGKVSGEKWKQDHVYSDEQLSLSRHHELLRSGDQLREMGESLRDTVKSWFPYEWFDTPEKLDFRGLPKYEEWYSKLKGDYVLTREEWEGCQRLFKEKGMCTFADWLRYYSNLDVAPGLEALEKMRAFYTDKGINILKDAVSIPGVSLHYLLRGCVVSGTRSFTARAKKRMRC